MDEKPELSARTPLLSVAAHERTPSRNISINRIKEVTVQRYNVCTLSVFLILATVFCEQFAFFSVLHNMVLFCTSKLDFTSFEATMTCWIFSGTVYMVTPLVGGYLADSLCGRYKTILGSGFIFVIGKILLFFSAGDFKSWSGYDREDVTKALFLTSLVVISIGSGGIQANIIPFGAQHVSHMGPRAVQTFCHWYYWARNIGSIASAGVVYLQQGTKQFCWGYLMSLLILVVGLVIFRVGKRTYKHVPPSESVLKKAITMCWKMRRRDRGQFNMSQFETSNIYDVKNVLKSLPTYGFITVYWMSYAQMSTSLFLQSTELDLSIDGVNIPPAFLIYFNPAMVVLCIPLMDTIIYPLLIKCGKGPTYLQRIGIGMFLAVLALCYAGGLEIFRKQHEQFVQESTNISYNASSISVFHQVPVFALLGLSEVWTSITGLEFAYTNFPDYMQGLITGLFLMTIGLGSVYSIILTAIVQRAKPDWYPNDPAANGHMEVLFFLIAGITFVFMLIFVFVTKFGYTSTQEDSRTQFVGSHNKLNSENT
ncbi:hypothetical protein ACJMK2_034919 [Sinanodonta woodiana]|uniref:Uncharacterized protein n=1 Tax=Sinanodonta woodiana TaxID=1069815 RepID=A0ABD3WVA6_SINWO